MLSTKDAARNYNMKFFKIEDYDSTTGTDIKFAKKKMAKFFDSLVDKNQPNADTASLRESAAVKDDDEDEELQPKIEVQEKFELTADYASLTFFAFFIDKKEREELDLLAQLQHYDNYTRINFN